MATQEEKKDQKKFTYEQLNELAVKLSQENSYLKNQLNAMSAKIRELSEFSAFKRLDYLFKVVELGPDKFNSDFVVTCAEEIRTSMTVVEDSEGKKDNDGKA